MKNMNKLYIAQLVQTICVTCVTQFLIGTPSEYKKTTAYKLIQHMYL